jgi:hypothetical protein
VLTPGGAPPGGSAAADTTLVKAVARAFRWRRQMETGRYGTINELAAAEKINSSYLSRLLPLTLLAPNIVEAILDGRQPEGMTLPGLMEPFPVEWAGQFGDAGGETLADAEAGFDLAHRHGAAVRRGCRRRGGRQWVCRRPVTSRGVRG